MIYPKVLALSTLLVFNYSPAAENSEETTREPPPQTLSESKARLNDAYEIREKLPRVSRRDPELDKNPQNRWINQFRTRR